MQDLGQATNLIGMQILDREATAAAKDADVAASDKIRALLYDPETGFANLRGSAAVNARASVMAQIDAIEASALEGLNGAARRKAADALAARKERALGTIDNHTSDQRTIWIDGARDARIEASYQDVLADPGATDLSLQVIEGEIRGRANDMGWSAEQTQFELDRARSTVYRGVAEKIAVVDPEAAAAYLQDHRSDMTGGDVTALETALIPMAKDAMGRRIGAAAAGGMPAYTYDTKIDFAMGPARPNKPAQPVLDVIGKSAEDVFGKGARVVVTSGEENEGDQHGSNRHQTGLAADIQIIRPDGSVVKATDPDMAAFAKAAALNGALGLGFGAEYMGGDHIHVDLVEPGAGQSNTWSSGANAMAGELVSDMAARKASGGMSVQDILAIPDGRVRKAALEELQLRSTIKSNEVKAARAGAGEAAFQYIEGGGSLNDLTVPQRQAIGEEGMNSLRTYEAKVKSGVPVETDLKVYADLRMQAATNPEGFRNLDLTTYADKLSVADRKALIDLQTKPVDQANAMSASSLMSVATGQLRGLGVKAGDPKEAAVQSGLLKWQDAFRAKEGRYPTQLEADQQVGRMLTEVVINPPGPWNEFSGMAYEVGQPLDIDGLTVPADVVNEQVNLMVAEGLEVNYDTLSARILGMMQ